MTRIDTSAKLGEGAVLLRGFALDDADACLAAIRAIDARSPFRHGITPGGFRMSAAQTNCGALGWVTDRSGYRYAPVDPATGAPWPAMPEAFLRLATRAASVAGFALFAPDACLLNRYAPGAKLSLHRDEDERDKSAPIVSVSLGAPATFLFGGLARTDPALRVPVEHGDVVVWGGPSRLRYHGVAPLRAGGHEATGELRFNLTFRKAGG